MINQWESLEMNLEDYLEKGWSQDTAYGVMGDRGLESWIVSYKMSNGRHQNPWNSGGRS